MSPVDFAFLLLAALAGLLIWGTYHIGRRIKDPDERLRDWR